MEVHPVPNEAPSQTPACSSSPSVRPAGAIGGSVPILTAALLWGTTGTASTLVPAGASAAAGGSGRTDPWRSAALPVRPHRPHSSQDVYPRRTTAALPRGGHRSRLPGRLLPG